MLRRRLPAAVIAVLSCAASVWAVTPGSAVAPSHVLEFGHGKLAGKPSVVTAVALVPGGKWIASGGDDHLVRIWNSETGVLAQTLKGHADWVRSLAFSPDGNKLVSAGDDHRLIEWSVDDGRQFRVLAEHSDADLLCCVQPRRTLARRRGLRVRGARLRCAQRQTGASAGGSIERPALGGVLARQRDTWPRSDEAARSVFGKPRDWSTALEIAADALRIRTLAYSPNGKKLAAAGRRSQRRHLGRQDRQGTGAAHLQAGQSHVAGLLWRRRAGHRRQRQRDPHLGPDRTGRTLAIGRP